MHKFSDFADETEFTGQKIKLSDILGKEITVLNYRITTSKYGDKQCLTVQIKLDGIRYVFFTGSTVLVNQCEKYKDEMPFLATIQKINKFYSFT